MQELIKKITNLINEYNQETWAPVWRLLDIQDKLCGYSFYLAEQSAQATKEANQAYYMRKIWYVHNFNKIKSDVTKKITDKLAENNAIESVKDFYQDEIEKNYTADRLKLVLNQVNKVLSAIQQRISHLKTENNNYKS